MADRHAGQPARSGRPRDAERERAILAAAAELLVEVGYEALTVDAIAARARASKATMYLRWRDKKELVLAALAQHVAESPAVTEDTGSLRGDLLAQCRLLAGTIAGADGRMLLALSRAATVDPDVRGAVEEKLGPRGYQLPRALVRRAVARGDLAPDVDGGVFEEIVPAILVMRLIVGRPIDENYLRHLVDAIVLPALRHARPA